MNSETENTLRYNANTSVLREHHIPLLLANKFFVGGILLSLLVLVLDVFGVLFGIGVVMLLFYIQFTIGTPLRNDTGEEVSNILDRVKSDHDVGNITVHVTDIGVRKLVGVIKRPFISDILIVDSATISSLKPHEFEAILHHELEHTKMSTPYFLFARLAPVLAPFGLAIGLMWLNYTPIAVFGYAFSIGVCLRVVATYILYDEERRADDAVPNQLQDAFRTGLSQLVGKAIHVQSSAGLLLHRLLDEHPPINERINLIAYPENNRYSKLVAKTDVESTLRPERQHTASLIVTFVETVLLGGLWVVCVSILTQEVPIALFLVLLLCAIAWISPAIVFLIALFVTSVPFLLLSNPIPVLNTLAVFSLGAVIILVVISLLITSYMEYNELSFDGTKRE